MYPWLKVFHLFFVVAWFVALFYLPRLFIYHLDATTDAEHQRFQTMERRLYIMGHIGMGGTLLLGLLMLWALPVWVHSGWLHAKLALVAVLILFYLYCGKLIRGFAANRCRHSAKWLRGFNEVPGALLIAILILVVVKPF